MRLLTLLRVPFGVWDEFCALGVGQLHGNLRRNGLRRKLLPPHGGVVNLIRLGCAMRVIDELAGEAPLPASALGPR